MKTQNREPNSPRSPRIEIRGFRPSWFATLRNTFGTQNSATLHIFVALSTAAILSGCGEDHRTIATKIRNLEVQTVIDQGLTLDQEAEPAAVVYTLLQAVRDDFDAGDDTKARESAFERQLALCAPDHIYSRALRRNLGREQSTQRIVWRWTPILDHYRGDFPTDWETGRKRLVTSRTIREKGSDDAPLEWTRVFLELASPDGNPNASVVAQFQLVREKGYWRIAQVGYLQGIRSLSDDQITRTSAKTADSPG